MVNQLGPEVVYSVCVMEHLLCLSAARRQTAIISLASGEIGLQCSYSVRNTMFNDAMFSVQYNT